MKHHIILKLISLLFSFFLCFIGMAQDSIMVYINELPLDSNRVIALNNHAHTIVRNNPQKSLIICNESLELAKKIGFIKGEIKCNNIMGMGYFFQSKIVESIFHFKQALELSESINDSINISKCVNNLGAISVKIANYEDAIKYNLQSLKICESKNDFKGMAKSYANIGITHKECKNYELADSYLHKGVTLADSINDLETLSICLNGLGSLYSAIADNEQSIQYFNRTAQLYHTLDDNYGLAIIYGAISAHYIKLNRYDSASIYIEKSQYYSNIVNDLSQEANNYINQSIVLTYTKNYNEALLYAFKAWDMIDLVFTYERKKEIALQLSRIYEKLNNYEQAFVFMRIAKESGDSALISEKKDLIFEIETKYQNVKKEQEIILLQKDKQLKQEQLERQKAIIDNKELQNYLIFLGLIMACIVVVILWINAKKNKKANDLLTIRKETIENQNNKITDSIVYAQSIQATILPSVDDIATLLPESFVLYKPLDIVSGDFYWIKEYRGNIIVAVVDCTGHGVPGAFMSILGNQLMNEIEDLDISAGKILDELRQKVKEAMKQSNYLGSQREGMEIGLCSINVSEKIMQFAGANMHLIRCNNGKIERIKGDKQPIAIFLKEEQFVTQTIPYNDHDFFYLYTDGYPDQFRVNDGKKFSSKRLIHTIKENSSRPMSEQKNKLEETFIQWKGDSDQIDDVTILGFKCP